MTSQEPRAGFPLTLESKRLGWASFISTLQHTERVCQQEGPHTKRSPLEDVHQLVKMNARRRILWMNKVHIAERNAGHRHVRHRLEFRKAVLGHRWKGRGLTEATCVALRRSAGNAAVSRGNGSPLPRTA